MKKLIILVHSLILFSCLHAEITLPEIVSSNMILQRNTDVVVWGWSDEKNVKIEASWLTEVMEIKVSKGGKWSAEIKTTDSKDSQTIIIQDKSSKVELTNILFGEVWLCSGQSNMAQPLKGYYGQPTYGMTEALLDGNHSDIRMFRIYNHASKKPLERLVNYSKWEEATPETIRNWSAVAYFFGKGLNQVIDVPIGLISSSRGGSSVQAWISKEELEKFEEVELENVEFTERTNMRVPTVFFNAMINPIIPYTIKGALWYQGEANRTDPEGYKELFPAMVEDWRNRWGIGDFPFYYAQIAPFRYDGNETYSLPRNSAFIREVQLEAVDIIPNSGVAVTIDVGEENYIHPPRKKEVGDRLLLLALKNTYGFSKIYAESPRFSKFEEQDGELLLYFSDAPSGLYIEGEPKGFEVAGEDHVFYPAEAYFESFGNLVVKSDKVAKPIAVRYGWDDWFRGNLFETNGLPVSSFRSDDWEDAKRGN